MCSVIGAYIYKDASFRQDIGNMIRHIMKKSLERGRDGFGLMVQTQGGPPYREVAVGSSAGTQRLIDRFNMTDDLALVLGNARAEPTTEFVNKKSDADQQPYKLRDWTIVHNGTIANDDKIRTGDYPSSIDSAAIVEMLCHAEFYSVTPYAAFREAVNKLVGSFAVIAVNNRTKEMFFATNYKPLWFVQLDGALLLFSSRHFAPAGTSPQMIKPYTLGKVSAQGGFHEVPLLGAPFESRALVVCSGGLDSVVAATYAKQQMAMDVTLLHFQYNCNAEGREVEAVQRVAQYLDCEVLFQSINVYNPMDSPILRKDAVIQDDKAGAEFAHEWVPARNLLMLSYATAIAEAMEYQAIVVGTNLEESGAYPDNEPEFIDRFNDILPFAVGANKPMKLYAPVGNLMKPEIVRLGLDLNAPLHATWSCYKGGDKHCGHCGPCYMRKRAFQINGQPDPIEYEV